MVTTNLGIIEPIESQEQKTLTISNALEKLDGATQGPTALTITGSKFVTADEFTEGFSLELTGTPGSPFNLTVPNTRRFFRVLNSTDDIATVKAPSAGDTVDIPVGKSKLLYGNADNDIFEEGSGSGVSGIESQEGGTPVVSDTVALNFDADHFDITDETAGVTGIALADRSLETKVQRITSVQDITTSPEQIQWNDEIIDEFAGHDNSTDNERIVIGTNIVDAQATISLSDVAGNAVTTARIVRYNSADALQEVVAEFEAEEDRKINFTALNVRGGAAGDYLVVDLSSTDADIDLDIGSFFLVRKAASGGGGGGAGLRPTQTEQALSGNSTSISIPAGVTWFRFGSTTLTVSDGTETLIVNLFHTGDTVARTFDGFAASMRLEADIAILSSSITIATSSIDASGTVRGLSGTVYNPRDDSVKTLAFGQGYNDAGNTLRFRENVAEAATDEDTIRFAMTGAATVTGNVVISWFYN